VDATDLPHATIADSEKLQVGDVVLAIGNPFGVGQTVTMGIVSGVGRTSLGITDYENFIQTDASINRGNSGGALIDAEGRLIGINTAIYSPSGGNAGIGFAVPVNMARLVMERLIQFGKVTRGYLGVNLQDEISLELARALRLPDANGAIVTEVSPNTPAARAGLKAGDIIREVDARPIADSAQLRLLISQKVPGSRVSMKVLRAESGRNLVERTIETTLGTLPENLANRRPNLTAPGMEEGAAQDALHGVEVVELDRNTRRRLNLPESVQGALVTSVDAESNAGRAGLRPGDVIQEIDQQQVRTAEDAVRLTAEAEGESIVLRVRRGSTSRYFVVQVPRAATQEGP
jgi:serine protease Do